MSNPEYQKPYSDQARENYTKIDWTKNVSPPSRQLSISKCSACGRNHKKMKFEQLYMPVEVGGRVMTHIGHCEMTGHPVYLRFK